MSWRERAARAVQIKATKRTPPLDVLHWVDFDSPLIGRRQRALCGELVYDYQSSNQPTCAQCQQEQARIEAMEF